MRARAPAPAASSTPSPTSPYEPLRAALAGSGETGIATFVTGNKGPRGAAHRGPSDTYEERVRGPGSGPDGPPAAAPRRQRPARLAHRLAGGSDVLGGTGEVLPPQVARERGLTLAGPGTRTVRSWPVRQARHAHRDPFGAPRHVRAL
ncbi:MULTISPECIES: hypothetical protein [unclassified Streptomyces]|uniref:hypothetical protein n=1 Tax=unclassified Streptomyces TaxID=2593676 RepID=UPI002DD7A956|nr:MULTISPECIES: hypothetical protein [unclassified Streptomyces]WSA91234.1 hypothetical protein OIE63_06475 [Streptomyces sp. NBC_01795]WSB75558.1 hypothetical protein OHB04_07005 [Streptomyces sp. NBC_01775]WSS16157.1 hypothetical protein OG533_32890 [Streptomyces sp. NBC_01186]WSS44976.1 hypothetical protein OG220_33565 [Streptomyces sp. NBC_01187]